MVAWGLEYVQRALDAGGGDDGEVPVVVDVASGEDVSDGEVEEDVLEKFVGVEDGVSGCAGGDASSGHAMGPVLRRVRVAGDRCKGYCFCCLEAARLSPG